MYPQINIPAQNIQNVILGERIIKTFQKNISKQELLEHSLVKTAMIYSFISNLKAGEKKSITFIIGKKRQLYGVAVI